MSNINNRILSQINSFNLGKFKLNKFKVRSLRYTIGLVVLLLLVNLGLFVPYVINLTYQRNISNLFSLYTKDKFGQWSSVDIAKIKSSQNTAKRFALASRVFPYFSTSRSIVRLEPFINQSFWLAEGWYDLSQVENQLLKKVISRQEINNNDINLVKDAVSRFDRRIVDFQAELIQPETEALIKKYVSDFDIKETKSLVVDLRLNLQKETLLIESMPKILAFKDNKSYVVIIQNDFELRSTGGLIDAYGYINFENGRLTGWRFFDADEMEKSLYARLEPPASLKRSLGESTWYFRDANWEVDFAVAAGRVLWFTEKGDKLIADGAMATDLKFWTQLSAILGGVNDISSGTLKDKDTVFKEMVTWASKDRLSLSAGVFCRDFVNSIVDNITQQVNQEEIVNKIRRQISQSIKQKDILLYFKDLEIQKIMANLGWDGKIKKFLPPADQKNIMADYLMINEANVGVNLANYFINRYITQQIEVSQNEINEQLRIKYSNGSNLNSWPGGSYKTYLRIYLPKEAILDSISLRQDQQTVPVNLTNLDSGTFEEKGYYGLLVEVLPRKETEVTVNYRNKTRVFDNKLATYLLLFQKQPGVESYDYTLEVKTLGDLVPLQLIPSGEISANGLQVNQSIREDQIFQADFGK